MEEVYAGILDEPQRLELLERTMPDIGSLRLPELRPGRCPAPAPIPRGDDGNEVWFFLQNATRPLAFDHYGPDYRRLLVSQNAELLWPLGSKHAKSATRLETQAVLSNRDTDTSELNIEKFFNAAMSTFEDRVDPDDVFYRWHNDLDKPCTSAESIHTPYPDTQDMNVLGQCRAVLAQTSGGCWVLLNMRGSMDPTNLATQTTFGNFMKAMGKLNTEKRLHNLEVLQSALDFHNSQLDAHSIRVSFHPNSKMKSAIVRIKGFIVATDVPENDKTIQDLFGDKVRRIGRRSPLWLRQLEELYYLRDWRRFNAQLLRLSADEWAFFTAL
jgi:hypothetical protein